MSNYDIENAVRTILNEIEPGPLRPDLEKTPERVAKALREMLSGYDVDIESFFTSFDGEGQDQVVISKDIPFNSICEHHLIPFIGYGHIAYLPKDKVIGTSKLPRLLYAFSHRLQLQERITRQVAESIMSHLEPRGVAVILTAKHGCVGCRGVKSDCSFITSVMLGIFQNDPAIRMEVLSLLGIK